MFVAVEFSAKCVGIHAARGGRRGRMAFPLGSSCASTLLPDPKPGRRYWACFIEASAFGCGSGAVVSTAGSGRRAALELGWPLPERVVPGSGLSAFGT